MAAGAIIGILGSIVVTEGIMALLKEIVGDPEADVQLALSQLAARNRRRAFALEASAQRGREDVEAKFARFNTIPQRTLTSATLLGDTPLETRTGQTPDTSLLDFVSGKMGTTPESLRSASAPRRAGDMSGLLRSISKPPTGGN